nr:hypothetical protein [Halobaculum sp. DT92]
MVGDDDDRAAAPHPSPEALVGSSVPTPLRGTDSGTSPSRTAWANSNAESAPRRSTRTNETSGTLPPRVVVYSASLGRESDPASRSTSATVTADFPVPPGPRR